MASVGFLVIRHQTAHLLLPGQAWTPFPMLKRIKTAAMEAKATTDAPTMKAGFIYKGNNVGGDKDMPPSPLLASSAASLMVAGKPRKSSLAGAE